ncbi:MAG: helix-turn-helix transcriptional regulator [Candidatus Micrarchaeota archaeon]|nr:helix-turn-helix transcriptional regulator [Candidatus Micrarchaeota archaeon]
MKYDKYDTLHIMMKRYSITILKAISDNPLRFSDLMHSVRNSKTLSINLSRLLEYGLIEIVPIKTGNKYGNFYRLSDKGKKLLSKIERI